MKASHARRRLKVRKHRWLRILSLVVAGVLLFLSLVRLYQELKTSVFLTKQWRTTIVFNTSPILVMSFPKEADESIMAVTIPESVYSHVPFGYGPYRMGAVWRLGELEKREGLFSETVADLLGVPISGWVGTADPIPLSDTDTVTLIRDVKARFGIWSLLRFQTNLNTLDKILLGWKIFQARHDLSLFAIHQNERLFVDARLIDGSAIKLVNERALDTFLEQKFEDRIARTESVNVLILNTTDTLGVGHKFSRFINNFGAKVMAVKNSDDYIETCIIETEERTRDTKIVTFLKTEFDCQVLEINEVSSAEILVKIGSLYGLRWQNEPLDQPLIKSEPQS